jgi:hypothetical protein
MRVGLHISLFFSGRRAPRKGAANPVHTYTGTVAGQEPGCVLVRLTSGGRGADQALIGATIRVRTHLRFPVWSAVRVRLRAADQSLVSIEQVS